MVKLYLNTYLHRKLRRKNLFVLPCGRLTVHAIEKITTKNAIGMEAIAAGRVVKLTARRKSLTLTKRTVNLNVGLLKAMIARNKIKDVISAVSMGLVSVKNSV